MPLSDPNAQYSAESSPLLIRQPLKRTISGNKAPELIHGCAWTALITSHITAFQSVTPAGTALANLLNKQDSRTDMQLKALLIKDDLERSELLRQSLLEFGHDVVGEATISDDLLKRVEATQHTVVLAFFARMYSTYLHTR